MADSSLSSAGWHDFKRMAPVTRAFNHLIAGTHFSATFRRWPLSPDDPRSTVNDFIFNRMIDPHWSALQLAFVDKETAKAEARRLAPDLRVPETLAVISMDAVRSCDHLLELLRPFIGTDAIAKPTHASGAALFMRNIRSAADLHFLYQLASVDYASIIREMQYRDLPRKIIVEALVPTSTGAPDDYKFHCVHGEPLVCQVDHNRFGHPWSRLLRVPDFQPMHAADGLVQPQNLCLPDPDRVTQMVAAARALAAPFDFVRVDLYNGTDAVYFGELTFTPGGALGIAPSAHGEQSESATHREYSRIVMAALKGNANGARL